MQEKRGPATMDRIAVRPLGARVGEMTLLPPGEIQYVFLGSAAPRELSAICVAKNWRLDPDRVYVRTARGIYWTRHRRLTDWSRELELTEYRLFFPIGRASMVNALKITALDTDGRPPLLVFAAADGQREILAVSRRAWPELRRWLRLR